MALKKGDIVPGYCNGNIGDWYVTGNLVVIKKGEYEGTKWMLVAKVDDPKEIVLLSGKDIDELKKWIEVEPQFRGDNW